MTIGALIEVVFKKDKIFDLAEKTVIGLGLGPLTISLFLFFLLLIFPNRTNTFYLIFIILLFVFPALIYRRIIINNLFSYYRSFLLLPNKIRSSDKLFWFLGFSVLIIGAYIFVQSLAYPFTSHDGSIYRLYGKYIYEQKNLNNYPMVNSDESTGFFVKGAQHPPGFPLIYTWLDLYRGGSSDGMHRAVTPLYIILSGAVLFLILRKRSGVYSAFLGIALLAMTPLLIKQSYENSIDPVRFYCILAPYLLAIKLLYAKNIYLPVLIGIILGLGIFIHTSGILIFFVLPLVLLFRIKGKPKEKIAVASLIVVSGLLIGGWQYGINYTRFHNITGPISTSIFKVKNIKIWDRGLIVNKLTGTTDLNKLPISNELLYGRLQMFSRPEYYGLVFYLLVLALLYWFKFLKRKSEDWLFIFSILLISIPVIYKYYWNPRYFFIILPLAIYFPALMLEGIYLNLKKRKLIKYFWICGAAMLGIIIFVFLQSSVTNKIQGDKNGMLTKAKYLISGKIDQEKALRPEMYEAFDYLNNSTAEDSLIVTSDNSRYYYFVKRKGLYWYDPKLAKFLHIEDEGETYRFMGSIGVDYVLLDAKDKDYNPVFYNKLKKLVTNQDYFEYIKGNDFRIYRIKHDQLAE